jgi:hypothetical protein
MPSTFAIGRFTGRRFPQFLGWGALALGLGGLLFGELRWYQQVKSLRWPKAPGVVIQAELGFRTQRHGRRHTLAKEYYADVRYAYQVNDRRYVAQRISLVNFDLGTKTGADARGFLADHPAHSSTDVYYDPGRPEAAILIREVDQSGHAWTRYSALALILLAMGILISSRKGSATLWAQGKTA